VVVTWAHKKFINYEQDLIEVEADIENTINQYRELLLSKNVKKNLKNMKKREREHLEWK
jgi:hypothetical protein